ncbi:sugar kinase [Pseudoclavibacter sp. RFBG4]|uniref:FGGY-family carbohydrate kinase n=1 Tax=Pseudoclavibacter sp. RFBG4 TaxID=2080575 RepID=UPI000CE88A68|nr:FGGY-family carbohydrate kinase [Pseudoclavibacter sp. RFBG4]PPG35232.1 sugar kinase [Pseudoclavibacter sp. RFBG4]
MAFYLAIDIGTEGARAGVFDEAGTRVSTASAPYQTAYPHPGWAEQNPRDWWSATVRAAREALETASVRSVRAVGVATTSSSVVVLDDTGAPIRPALLWMDSRAGAESERTAEIDHPSLRFAGGSDSSEWLIPKAMWLARNEPENYAAATHIGESVDYMTLRLTGRWVGSRLNATCKWNYDHREDALPSDLYAQLGIPDLAEKLPHDIAAVGDIVGELSRAAAAELGVEPGAIVFAGGIDAHLALVALSGVSRNPVAIVAGTSNAFIAELDEPVFSPTIWGPYPGALTHDRWLIEGGQVSAGSALSWLSERILGVPRDRLGQLVSSATEVPAAEHGILVLDHFMGNRTPHRDPSLRGAVLGLSLGATPAQLYRATVEAVSFGTRQVLESFEAVGVDSDDVFLTGGIRHNPLWLQTTADALGRPVNLVSSENLTTLALGILGVAADTGEDRAEVARRFAPDHVIVDPNPAATQPLADAYERYERSTQLLTGMSHELVRSTQTTARVGAA